MVEAGLGLAFISAVIAEREIARGALRALPIAGVDLWRDFSLVTLRTAGRRRRCARSLGTLPPSGQRNRRQTGAASRSVRSRRQVGPGGCDGDDDDYRSDSAADDQKDRPEQLRRQPRLEAAELVRAVDEHALDGGDPAAHLVGNAGEDQRVAHDHADSVEAAEHEQRDER